MTTEKLSQCKICGCLWRDNPPTKEQPQGSVSLAYPSQDCHVCCDNVPDTGQYREVLLVSDQTMEKRRPDA